MRRPIDLNALPLDRLFAALVDVERFDTLISLALEEDLGAIGDVTTNTLVPPDAISRAAIVARADGVVAGLPVVDHVLAARAPSLDWSLVAHDGDACRRGDTLISIEGPLVALLPLERTLLNFLGRLCGIATLTRRHVDAVRGTSARVCCTRKTTPGWRELEKYAVRCGGGWLHRISLQDAMLVKDNHLGAFDAASFGDAVAQAARTARSRHSLRFVEVEVDTLEQFDVIAGLEPGVVDIILLDNFPLDDLREAVRRRAARGGRFELEASGGVRLDTIGAIAACGVDRISCGALTHSAISLDVALDLLGS
jgi:nicotinate-nucleotide pyrophosphorylase (carboxylating)